MMRLRLSGSQSLFPAVLLGAAIGLTTLLQGGVAEAGRAHFSGSAHFGGGGARFSGSVRWHGRGFARPTWRPWGRVWVGGYYAPRPYYYYYYPAYPAYPEAVPSYYGPSYYPVQPSVAPGVVATAPLATPEPAMPMFGIGVFAGGTSVHDDQESSDLGALVRFRLTPGLLIEGEIARTDFKDNVRVDRRLGGSLIYEIAAHNTFAPYILAGGGVQQAKVDGDFTTTQDYGEVGVGLRLALSRNLHITADVRAGRRKTVDSDQPVAFANATARSIAPPSGVAGDNDTEDYTRGRIAAILNF